MQRIGMVSFLCLLLAVSMVCGNVWADRKTYDPTKTALALPLTEAPIIDGVIDTSGEQWNYAGGNNANWKITVNTTNDAQEDTVRGGEITSGEAPIDNNDLSFNIWVGYDKDNLYVGVRVLDSDIQTNNAAAGSANGSTWTDDSVEVFVDGDNSNFATSDTTGKNPEVVGTGGQYVITANNAYREAEAGNPGYGESKAWYAQTSLTDTGYDAEFRISLKTIGSPQLGDIIGFTVAVNDSDSDGTTKQIIWVGKTHTEVTYGNLLFGPRSYVAPKVTTAPKLDGKIDTGEYAGAQPIVMTNHIGYWDTNTGDDAWPDGDDSLTGWVTHDAQAIYAAFDVVDDIITTDTAEPADEADGEGATTWEDDSVEIFFDVDYDRNQGSFSSDVPFEGQYVITANGAHRDNEAGNPIFGADGDWNGMATLTTKGFQVEFRILKATLQDPKDDTVLGFNIALNDDDGAGRKSQLQWQGMAHYEASYGTITFSSKGGTAVSDWSLF